MSNKILTRQEAYNIGGGGTLSEPSRLCTIAMAESYDCINIKEVDSNKNRLIWSAEKQSTPDIQKPDWFLSYWGFSIGQDESASIPFCGDDDELTDYGWRPVNYDSYCSIEYGGNVGEIIDYRNVTNENNGGVAAEPRLLMWPDNPVNEFEALNDAPTSYIEGFCYNNTEYEPYVPKTRFDLEINVGFFGTYLAYGSSEKVPHGLAYVDWSNLGAGFLDYKWYLKYANYNRYLGDIEQAYTSNGHSLSGYIDDGGHFTCPAIFQFSTRTNTWHMTSPEDVDTEMSNNNSVFDLISSLRLVAVNPCEVSSFSVGLTLIE